MTEMLKYMEEAYAKLLAGRPAEMANLFERNKENGKHFSVWVNAYVSAEEANAMMFKITDWSAKKEGDLATLKMVGVSVLKSAASTFKISFGMMEYSELLLKAADGIAACQSYEDLNALSRAIHLYLVRMWYWIDGLAPWAKMSKFFNETMGL